MTPQDRAVVAVAFVTSLLSALGALFIIVSWASNRTLRIFFLRLVMFLSCANFCSALAYAMSLGELLPGGVGLADTPHGAGCLLQAWLMTIFESAGVLWTVAIAWTLHEQVAGKSSDVQRVERLERLYHGLCWGLPLGTTVVLFAVGELGPATPGHSDWCWIAGGASSSRRAGWAQLLVFYVPLVLAFAFNAAVYLRVSAAFRKLGARGDVEASKERVVQLRLRLYLLVPLVVWSAPLADRTAQLISPGLDLFPLRLLAAATAPGMGLLNALVYGCNAKTLAPYRQVLRAAWTRAWMLPPPTMPGRVTGSFSSREQTPLGASPPGSFSEALLGGTPTSSSSPVNPMQSLRTPLPATPQAGAENASPEARKQTEWK